MKGWITVVGGGLAGCEAAWAAARLGAQVRLYEMRPGVATPAHGSDMLAELVCSNSLKSMKLSTASGILKEEMSRLGSLTMECANKCAVDAGDALAVDRAGFSALMTERVLSHPKITLIRKEVTQLEGLEPVVVASGPLTSEGLARTLQRTFSELYPGSRGRMTFLSFYDAISPIISADSIEEEFTFRASRYHEGPGDYINCPLDPPQYKDLVEDLRVAEVQPLRPFEKPVYFEGCLPVEELARRGEDALRFGPMKPVGLKHPRTGRRPYAVVQLRIENREATMYNLVGFQTHLKWGEQKRIFRKIPGLGEAEFLRYGQVHRNTFVNSPMLLERTQQLKGSPGVFISGQLIGVEGYMESAASGIMAGINAVRFLRGETLTFPPPTTCIGSLLKYVTEASPANFQPMNANFGLFPPLVPHVRNRLERKQRFAERALSDLDRWREGL